MYIERLISVILAVCGIIVALYILYLICNSDDETIEMQKVETQMQIVGKSVNIPSDSLLKINVQKDVLENSLNKRLRFICYIDSSSCSTCTISGARVWDGIVAMTRKHGVDVMPVFVLHVPVSKKEKIIAAVGSSRFKHEVYLDTTGIFQHSNLWIATDETYVVLIDENNRIVFVGDPTHNEIIQNDYFKYISRQSKC